MTRQIAVKLPDGLLDAVDRLVQQGHVASRSEAVRRGLAALLERARSEHLDEAFRSGFRAQPQTDQEVEEAYRRGSPRSRRSPGSPGGSPRRGLVGRDAGLLCAVAAATLDC